MLKAFSRLWEYNTFDFIYFGLIYFYLLTNHDVIIDRKNVIMILTWLSSPIQW